MLPEQPLPLDDFDEREIIIAAAYRLVGNQVRPTPLRAILDEAGLSTRAFYRHFDSKDDLILTMFRARSGETIDNFRAIVESTHPPIEKLEAWVRRMIGAIFENTHRWSVVVSAEAYSVPGYIELLYATKAEVRETLRNIIEEGVADGSFHTQWPARDAYAINAIAEAYDRGHIAGIEKIPMAEAISGALEVGKKIVEYDSAWHKPKRPRRR